MIKTIVCRAWQQAARVAEFLLTWREPTQISGVNSVLKLSGALLQNGVRKPLLITGPTLHRLGVTDGLARTLSQAGIPAVVFDRVLNDPTIANVEEAAACYRENGCDAIIAFGGGSPMDCAKLCGARIARPDRPVSRMKGMLKVRRRLPPLYAVPTTSGTGSEVTIAAVVTDEQHRKYGVTDPVLIPDVAVLDPALTLGMPPSVTASSGMDALCHAVEAFIGHSNTKKTRSDALHAVKLVFASLPTAYRNGADLEARTAMQQAAFFAGKAFTRAYVGYAHAVAHAIGGKYGVAHGVACAVSLPFVLRAYGQAACPVLAELADTAGIGGSGESTAEKAATFITALETLNAQLNLPQGFSQIMESDIPHLAELAAQEGNLFYPAPRILFQPELEKVLAALAEAGKANVARPHE